MATYWEVRTSQVCADCGSRCRCTLFREQIVDSSRCCMHGEAECEHPDGAVCPDCEEVWVAKDEDFSVRRRCYCGSAPRAFYFRKQS